MPTSNVRMCISQVPVASGLAYDYYNSMPRSSYVKSLTPIFFSHNLKPSEMSALYITHAIRMFATALVGIYLPIYIFTLDSLYALYEHTVVNGIVWVLLYFLVRHLTFLLSNLALTNVMFVHLGFRKSILVSAALLGVRILLLFPAQSNPLFILLSGFFSGLNMFFYWIPYHIFFLRKASDSGQHFGKETGIRFFLVRAMNALGPLIGGVVISAFGFGPLFVASIVLIIASTIPVLMEVHENVHHHHDIRKIAKKYISNRAFFKDAIAFAGNGGEDLIVVVFWPILLYVVLSDFSEIGILSGVTLFISSIMVLIVGKYIDTYGAKHIHHIGIVVNTGNHFIRMLITMPLGLYLLDFVDRINSALYAVPFMSVTYEKARKSGHDADYILFREMMLHSGVLLTTVVALIAVPLLPDWRYVFMLGAAGSLATYFINR